MTRKEQAAAAALRARDQRNRRPRRDRPSTAVSAAVNGGPANAPVETVATPEPALEVAADGTLADVVAEAAAPDAVAPESRPSRPRRKEPDAMLIPRRVKHRKQHHPGRSGAAKGGTRVTFGEYGIQALEPAYVTNRQIESARIAITRHIRRGGKVWINIYPDRPLTKKPAETRMGSGKGSPEWWIANVKPGRVHVRAVRTRTSRRRSRGAHPRDPQAADEVPHREARGG